jgi:hypothetical protein
MSFPGRLYQKALRLTFDGLAIENFGEGAVQNKSEIGQFMAVPLQPMVWQMCSLSQNKARNLGSLKA